MQKYVPLVKQNAMKLEVFILGGQRIDQERKKDSEEGEERGLRKGTEYSAVSSSLTNPLPDCSNYPPVATPTTSLRIN